LRQAIREREPRLTLGGWANPHGDTPRQVAYLADDLLTAEFYLTQIVSHHHRRAVERFVAETARRGITFPGMFGVFYYRSANARTLRTLSQFLPVPVEELAAEFANGATPVEICARTLRALTDVGVRHFYVSNLPLRGTAATLNAILERMGAMTA
jgi:hypothetical protein